MAVKVEDTTGRKLPRKTRKIIQEVLGSVPREHLRGLEKVRLVNQISDPRLKNVSQQSGVPGLYHPRQGAQMAWIELAADSLLPSTQPLQKRLVSRLSYQGNLAALLFSLIGQHYHLTLRHSVKKTQLETVIRAYAEKNLRAWHQRRGGIRMRLFKPFQPTLEKWGRALQKRVAAEKKKQQSPKS